MKNKRNTGLRAGVYQESSDQKSTLFDLLASILIFLAFAAVCYTVSGFSAMLWLLGAGILTCIAAAIIPHSAGGTAARCFVRAEPAAERLRCGVEHAA